MTDNPDLYERFFKCLGFEPDGSDWLEPIDKRIRDVEAETKAMRALNQLYKDNDKAMKTLADMKPNSRVILERCIEEGTKRGYKRAFKHTDSPLESGILQSIEDAVWLEIDTYFNFDNNDLL